MVEDPNKLQIDREKEFYNATLKKNFITQRIIIR